MAHSKRARQRGTRRRLTVSTLGVMTAASIVTSLRGLSLMAKEELTMFVYIGFSTFLFLIPAGLVAAELGGAFGERAGGLYVWVAEAFNRPAGFVAMFLSWVQNIVWYPAGLSFASAAAAFAVGRPRLAGDHVYVGLFIIIAFWLCTLAALVGNRFAGGVTKYGFLLGTVIPGLILLAGFLAWLLSDQTIGWSEATSPAVAVAEDGHAHPRWFPYLTGLSGLSFLAGILLNFAGVESQAVHAMDLRNPRSGYPMVIAIAALLSFGIFTLGSLTIAGILPYREINIESGVFDAFDRLSVTLLHTSWPVRLISVLICYGALGGVLAWIIGPSRGLLATARDGLLPPFMQKTNRNGVQINILVIQGVIVAVIASIYLFLTSSPA
ncbi:putative transporter [Streptosporangium violaceochromogenes]|nr:putative transporter [Streptosporangium violaceochromogenes]